LIAATLREILEGISRDKDELGSLEWCGTPSVRDYLRKSSSTRKRPRNKTSKKNDKGKKDDRKIT